LRKRAEFLAVQHEGEKFGGRHFVVLVRPGGAGRVGITVSTRVAKAVGRNRIKRWVREAVRRYGVDGFVPPAADLVVIARSESARAPSFAAVAADLDSLRRRWWS
jgi:ribonuclease P protein component